MTNIDIKVVGTANVNQMHNAFGKLQAQIAATNAELTSMVNLQNGVDGAGFARAARAAQLNQKAYSNAVASTGAFEQMQLRVNRATDDYVKKLNAQKLSFREMAKQRKVAAAAYKEQIAMEQMVVRSTGRTNSRGKQLLDVAYAKEVSAELDTAGRRLAWWNEQLKSGSHQMVNWGKNTQWAGRQLTVGFTMPMAAAGAAAGVLAYQIDKEFTRIAKVYDTTANANSKATKDQIAVERELMELREQGTATAIKAAKEYGVAATDTLNVQAELAATGQRGADLQKATSEVMRIARLGELDYQTATQATIALQTVFRLSTEELTEAFNYMNSIENATSLTTQDFATAIPIAAGTVREFGGDVKELGVLLTAMKSRGIEASQAANGLKATMQRLGRPSKQIQQEFKAITGTDLKELVDTSGSLTEIFQRLRAVTKDLEGPERRDVFAGVFGSYQVKQMMALVDGMEDIEKGYGQTAEAAKIAQQSASDWAATANREMERYQKSISGQWDTAFQEMKVQLSTLGEPFVQVATIVLKSVSKIIEMFNGLPGPVKAATAIILGIGAVAGPLIMLTGLMFNLFGNVGKVAASIIGLGAKMKILDTESRVAQLAASQLNTSFVKEKTAVQLLTVELEKMTLAQKEANAVMMQAMGINPRAVPANGTAWLQSKAATDRDRGLVGAAAESKKIEESAKRTSTAMRAQAGNAAILLTSLVAMSNTSDGIAHDISQWVFNAALVAPIIIEITRQINKARAAQRLLNADMAASGAAGKTGLLGQLGGVFSKGGKGGVIGLAIAGVAAAGVTAYHFWKKSREEAERIEAVRQKEISDQRELLSVTESWAKATGRTLENYKMISVNSGKILTDAEKTAYQQSFDYFSKGEGKQESSAFGKLDDLRQNTQLMVMFNELTQRAGLSIDEARTQMLAFSAASGKSLAQANDQINTFFNNVKGWGDKKIIANAYAEQYDTFLDLVADGADEKIITANGTKAGELWGAAFTAGGKKKRADMGQSLVSDLTQISEESFNKIREQYLDAVGTNAGNRMSQDLKMMLSDFDKFKAAWDNGSLMKELDKFRRIGTGNGMSDVTDLADSLTSAAGAWKVSSSAAEKSLLQGFKNVQLISDEVTSIEEAFADPDVFSFLGKEQQDKILSEQISGFERMKQGIENMSETFPVLFNKEGNDEALDSARQKLLDLINAANQSRGFAVGEDIETAMANLVHEIPATKEEIDKLKDAAEDTAGHYNLTFDVTAPANIAKMAKQAMTDIQEQIADSYRDALDARQEAAMDSRQTYWDNQAESQQKRFDRQSEAQEKTFNREEKRLDAKWDRRKDKATKYWDSRIDAVNKAIEAEQHAEDVRQKMFDAEMDRISRLNESMNRNIDFNVALNEGNLDEAAKIRNDVFAASTNNALENGRDAGSSASEARVKALQDSIDGMETERDAYMDNLNKKEEAEKAHLKRSQERQAKALKAQQDAQSKALKARTDADIKGLQRAQAAEQASLQQRLAMFMNYIAANEGDLKRHMGNVGLTYEEFGKNVLHPKAERWGSWYGKAMKQSLKNAALEMESDAMWEQLAQSSVKKLVKGMGFKNRKQFFSFVESAVGKSASDVSGDFGSRHEGGIIDSSPGSRKGVARTTRGLHSSERLIRAQDGEFMVNRKAAAANMGLLTAINSGKRFGTDTGIGGMGMQVPLGPASVPMAGIAYALLSGISSNLQKAKSQSDMEAATYSGPMGSHKYSLPGVKPWVFEAANYLGNKFNIDVIGGLGSRSRKSEHPLGLALDFMTSDDRGTALANEVVRINGALDAMYVIWRQRINSFDGRGWRAMADRGSPTENHMDHVHVSFKSSGKTGDLPALFSGGFKQGSGGTHRPVKSGGLTQGLHYNNAVDFGVPRGTPVYAYADGVVTSSRDIAGPLPTDRYHGDGPYGSYGRVIEINHGGFSTLYAHLGSRFAQDGQEVKGGAKIGLSGNTGNSSGPHLHFGMPGAKMPAAFLKKGGTVKKDGTPAVLHKDERVLTAPLTKKLDLAIDAMYTGEFGIGGKGDGKKKKKKTVSYLGVPGPSGDSWSTLLAQLAVQQSRFTGSTSAPAPIPTAWLMNTPFAYPEQMASAANSPHTWFNYSSDDPKPEDTPTSGTSDVGVDPGEMATNLVNDAAVLAGSKFTTAIANLNTRIDVPAAQTVTDVKKLIGMSDIITLTEMSRKIGPVRDFLQSKGWGLFAGTSKADKADMSTIAYNKAKYSASEGGTQKLGDKMGNFLGGREYRYANYLKLRNKATGGSFWQIAAHTVPTSGPDLKGKRLAMYNEQWGALDTLVNNLGKGGLPVFLSGDLNNAPGQKGWRTPGNLKNFSGRNVDWIFSNPKLAKLLSEQAINGMHTDHAGAWLSKFKIPSLSKGAMDVRFDDTLANLHAGEAVLTKDINSQFRQGVENFANGGGNNYNLNMNITEPGASADAIANKVILKLERREARRPGSRRN